MASHIGRLHRHHQANPHRAADTEYWRIAIINEEGEFETILLTDHELEVCRERGEKNPEDLVEAGFMDKMQVKTLGALGETGEENIVEEDAS